MKQKWIRDVDYHRLGTLIEVKKATKSAYLIYLHYKVITRTITTNKYLHILQLKDNNACTFCKRDVETITHLFWECPVTQTLIQNIGREIYTKYRIHFKHNIASWFFPHETDELQTLMITLVKAVIYKARNKDEKPELSHMLNLLKNYGEQEHYSCKINDKLEAFNNKWKTLSSIVS